MNRPTRQEQKLLHSTFLALQLVTNTGLISASGRTNWSLEEHRMEKTELGALLV